MPTCWVLVPVPLPSRKGHWPGPEYHIRVTFRAPLRYVYSWCTDYSEEDPKISHEAPLSERRIIAKGRGRVVFEDLEELKDGTAWDRVFVRLEPPRRWQAFYVGNYRHALANYSLSTPADGRTQLDIRWRRRPSFLEGPVISKRERERSSLEGWRWFAKRLERDYRGASSRTARS